MYTLEELIVESKVELVLEAAVKAVITALHNKFGRKSTTAPQDAELERRLRFGITQTKYLGEADNKFYEYLQRCYLSYASYDVMASYVTAVQSSGFGKSRLLYELAQKALGGSEGSVKDLKRKVVYTSTSRMVSRWQQSNLRIVRIGTILSLGGDIPIYGSRRFIPALTPKIDPKTLDSAECFGVVPLIRVERDSSFPSVQTSFRA